MYSPRQLAEILRETIRTIEQDTDISPNDPALLELKRIILLRVAKLEAEAPQEPSTEVLEIPLQAPINPKSN